MANQGDTVTLECMVDAHPEPKMMFWRDAQGRTPVIQSSKHDVNVIRSKEDYTKFVMELTISKLTETDDGDYFCHAENSFGSSTKPVSVRIRNSVSRAQYNLVIFQFGRLQYRALELLHLHLFPLILIFYTRTTRALTQVILQCVSLKY
jgi:hypothetical protein